MTDNKKTEKPKDCVCGQGNRHSLRSSAACDGQRKYGANYKPRKRSGGAK